MLFSLPALFVLIIAESFITEAHSFSTDTTETTTELHHKSTKWTKVSAYSDATINFVVAMNQKNESSKDTTELHHKSTKWTKVSASSDATVIFVVAMNPKNESSKDLRRFLDKSSDPLSDMYGKILSKEEFESMRVDLDAYEKVRSYLKNEIPSARFDRVGRHLIVSGVSVKEIDRLFDTKMEMFRHKVTKHIVHNSLKRYTIPSEISEYVRHVFGLSSTLVDALDVVQRVRNSLHCVTARLARLLLIGCGRLGG